MSESVLLNTPLGLALFVVAALLNVFDIKYRASGYVFGLVAAVLFTAGLTYSLLMGVTMQEVLIVALIFFALNLNSFKEGERL